jgi:anti-anti-sigma regulatory factor
VTGVPNVVTIRLDQSAQAMRQVALTALQGPSRDVVIDLRDAVAMTHQELALLIGVRARQRSRGRRLTLVCAPDSATEKALSRAGMRKLFTTVTTLPQEGESTSAVTNEPVAGRPTPTTPIDDNLERRP